MNETSTENRIILFIKEKGPVTLQEIADNLGITKMGAYKHVTQLERKGLISRKVIKKEVGRPSYVFNVTESGKLYFTNSDSLILLKFLDYIKREGKDELVIKFLKDRFKSLYNEYKDKLDKKDLDEKVEILGKLRTSEGYMAEVKKCGNSFELMELNCPIYRIASLFGEACSMERDLFSKVLDAEVENSHRQVDNSNVCRFIIRPKSNIH
nr:MarR family transcriptional regulator [Acidianus brierleyi]